MRQLYKKIDGFDESLKGCPFCGEHAELWEYSPINGVFQKVARCSNGSDENAEPPIEGCPMYMSTPEFHKETKSEAVKAWNKRAI